MEKNVTFSFLNGKERNVLNGKEHSAQPWKNDPIQPLKQHLHLIQNMRAFYGPWPRGLGLNLKSFSIDVSLRGVCLAFFAPNTI